MGSRSNRKARKRLLEGQIIREQILQGAAIQTETEVKLPDDDKVVLKKVPAKVDGEVIGEAVLYEDGTSDIIINDDLSDEIREKLKGVVVAFNKETGANFSIEEVLGKGF